MFASTTLVVVWIAMYLTGYSEYLNALREPHSPSYRCHTVWKKKKKKKERKRRRKKYILARSLLTGLESQTRVTVNR